MRIHLVEAQSTGLRLWQARRLRSQLPERS